MVRGGRLARGGLESLRGDRVGEDMGRAGIPGGEIFNNHIHVHCVYMDSV